jgi:type II secretion system protein N
MEEKSLPRWVPLVGYPLFFIFAFVIFFHLTLPYGVIQARIVEEARRQGYTVTMASVGPALGFGMTARSVFISPIQPGAATPAPDAAPAPALGLEQLTVRPAVFPLGANFSAKAFGGSVSGSFTDKGKNIQALEVHGKNLELARAGLKPMIGLDMEGRVNVDGDFSTNPNDFTKTTGSLKVSGKEMTLLGGTVNFVDLPRAVLGALDLKVKAEGGKATLDTFAVTGGEIEARGEGDVTFGQRLIGSSLNVKLEFKPQDEWLKKYSFIQTGLSMAGHPSSSGFYTATLDGSLMSPRTALR